ncbi:MAG: hypothetical protein KatS3mg087_2083 [Patescibacteria group bacterium]|nr:MAG: hypothetical protein KatS3mg087_2083 [Patescibacteria group bacterium]
MRLIKQNDTSKPIVFRMVDSADHITGKTGLTPTVTISKNGGAFAPPSGAVSEIGDGWYKLTPAAADVDTLGPLIIHATATGADPTDVEYQVVARDPYTNQTDLNMDQALPASPTPNTVGASLVAANQEGQPTAVLFPVTPPFVDLPASGTKMCRIWLLVFDGNMQPLDLAANPTVTAENHAGQDRSTKLGPVYEGNRLCWPVLRRLHGQRKRCGRMYLCPRQLQLQRYRPPADSVDGSRKRFGG